VKTGLNQKECHGNAGLLLFGTPGNGKSSLVKALAQEINVPIMVFDMSTMTNKDFSKYWNQVVSNTPCIVLLEDIDAVFDGRKNLSTCDGALSFDCLLNHLDGVQANDGIFTIITTNNIDKIDSAIGIPNGDNISTRPGRIDRAIEMVNPDEAGRYKIAKRILNDFPEKIDETVKAGSHDTGAQFQERCARLALQLFWENKGNKK
jgi:SpoVK/Ycf46/Vps4 family AAA+-type ATPase